MLPTGWTFGAVSAVAVDSQDRVYAFQRKDPPVLVFDREGNFLQAWGSKAMRDPHGIYVGLDDIVYLTDRDDHVALKFTLDGRPLSILGERGQHSDTGCEEDGALVPRTAGPFNKPTEMVVAPSGDLYVTDGYRNSLEAGWEFGEMIYGSRVHLRGLKKRPLEYLEHLHWAVASEDSLIAEVVKRWGAERILFSTDYPRGDTLWPESVKERKEALAPYSAADQAKVLGDNAVRVLHL